MSERAACGLSILDGNVPIKSKKKNQATGKSNIGQNTLQLGFFRGFFAFHLRVSFISPLFSSHSACISFSSSSCPSSTTTTWEKKNGSWERPLAHSSPAERLHFHFSTVGTRRIWLETESRLLCIFMSKVILRAESST
jgi:hypothetical protein